METVNSSSRCGVTQRRWSLPWIAVLWIASGSLLWVAAAEEKAAGEKAAVEKAAEKPAPEEKAVDEKKPAEAKPEAEKKDAEKPSEKTAEKAAEKPPKPPAPPLFRLRDGTRISGFPEIQRIGVHTSYGSLVIPRDDLVRIRFAREKDPLLQDRIKAHVAKLGSEEFEEREQAMADLREIGLPALKLLKEAVKSEDEEVKTRAQTLVAEIEESADVGLDDQDEDEVPIRGDDDEVVTVKFIVKGKVEEGQFQVRCNYGNLTIDRKDIISIVFQEFAPSEVDLRVPSSFLAPNNSWLETKIPLEKGDRLEISAGGQIQLLNYGWTVGPEGTTNIGGNHFENFPAGSLVARVGKKGKPFLVGPGFKGEATDSGKLMFAIAFRGGRLAGEFEVSVRVRRSEEQ